MKHKTDSEKKKKVKKRKKKEIPPPPTHHGTASSDHVLSGPDHSNNGAGSDERLKAGVEALSDVLSVVLLEHCQKWSRGDFGEGKSIKRPQTSARSSVTFIIFMPRRVKPLRSKRAMTSET